MELLAFILTITAEKITDAEAQAALARYIEENPGAVDVQVATAAETIEYLGLV